MKPINWYEWLYSISESGDIMSHEKIVKWKGNSVQKRKEITLKKVLKKNWYEQVCLYKNSYWRIWNVHRLVAENFIQNPHKKKEVNHKNGIKSDNRVQNLEWCTRSENAQHAHREWLQVAAKWEDCSYSKLTEMDVIHIKKILKQKALPQHKIGKMFWVSRSAILWIKSGKNWKHITI
jgi:hypothetical protein